jgi:hypothetical protein
MYRNGLHGEPGQNDPHPELHVTIRLSNPALREQRMWYILHWRPIGTSIILPRPDSEERNLHRRNRRREKKQRQRLRKKLQKDHDNQGGSGSAGDGGAAIAS